MGPTRHGQTASHVGRYGRHGFAGNLSLPPLLVRNMGESEGRKEPCSPRAVKVGAKYADHWSSVGVVHCGGGQVHSIRVIRLRNHDFGRKSGALEVTV